MIIKNIYENFNKIKNQSEIKDLKELLKKDEHLEMLLKMAQDWEINLDNVQRWMNSSPYEQNRKTALVFTKNLNSYVEKIETILGTKLQGELLICPSLMQFDGFARYDSGHHRVWFGVDHPDADENYLKALLAHELSHVYRDHQPGVWGFLGKPLEKIKRKEYLDNMSAEEHLVSEGLATLFSQIVFPEIDLHVHHYYDQIEMQWCFDNLNKIENAIHRELKTSEQNVWKFYEEDMIEEGSPSRTQYFWAAYKIRQWLELQNQSYSKALIDSHGKAALEFECFRDG